MNSRTRTKFLIATALSLTLAEGHGHAQAIYEPYAFTTIAGKAGVPGSADGTNSVARFRFPNSLVVDGAGRIYVTDTYNHTIRSAMQDGTNWVVSTVAGRAGSPGSVDGTGSNARFNLPGNIAVDKQGSLYLGDGGHTVRKLTLRGTNWQSTTIVGLAGLSGSADGTNSDARLTFASGVAVDPAGTLYISDSGNNTIRKITPVGSNWVMTTVAGVAGYAGSTDGIGSAARFDNPSSLALDSAGNIFVTEAGNKTVRQIKALGTNWIVSTVAGMPGRIGSADGVGSMARFTDPEIVAVDNRGNLYVSEFSPANTVRKLKRVGTNWVSSTIGGQAGHQGSTDGIGRSALFWGPSATVDAAGNLYVADVGNDTIRKGIPALALISSGPSFGLVNGLLEFDVAGPEGHAVVVEASSDLLSWLPIWTNSLTGTAHFMDSQPWVETPRFYRAKLK